MAIKLLNQPLRSVPDNTYLPPELHPLADRWRDLEERAEIAYAESGALEWSGMAEAKHKDQHAMAKAIEEGTDLPEGNEYQNAAKAKAEVATNRFRGLERALYDCGSELLAQMRAHRQEIAELVRPRVATALSDYVEAVNEAEKTLTELGGTLATEAAKLTYLDSIDTDTSDVDSKLFTVPPPALSDAKAAIANVKEWQIRLDEPAPLTRFTIVGSNGLHHSVEAPTALSLITSGTAQLVDPDQMEQLRQAAGVTERQSTRATGQQPTSKRHTPQRIL